MSRLIKNELYKLFHKLGIYIIALLILISAIFSNVMQIMLLELADNEEFFEQENVKFYEQSLQTETDPEIRGSYLTELELSKLRLKYINDDTKIYYINTEITQVLSDMNYAKLVENDDAKYEELKAEYEKELVNLENFDWKEQIAKETEELKKEIETYNEIEETTEYQNKRIQIALERFDALSYRLDNNIPYSNSKASSELSEYYNIVEEYAFLDNNDSTYRNYQDLLNKKETEKTYKELQYKINNNLIKSSDGYNTEVSVAQMLVDNTQGVTLFLIIVATFFAGQVLSSEFEKGTIKQLLVKPYSREKILTSKIIATTIVFFGFTLYFFMVYTIVNGCFWGFESLKEPVIIYDFNLSTVRELSLWYVVLVQFLTCIPRYLITILFTIAVSTIVSSTAIAMMAGLTINVVDTFTDIISKKLIALMPTTCWNFNIFLFGGYPQNEYSNLPTSILVTVLFTAIIIAVGYIGFKNKEVKNQ